MKNKEDETAFALVDAVLNILLLLILLPLVVLSWFVPSTKPRKKGHNKWKA